MFFIVFYEMLAEKWFMSDPEEVLGGFGYLEGSKRAQNCKNLRKQLVFTSFWRGPGATGAGYVLRKRGSEGTPRPRMTRLGAGKLKKTQGFQ